MKKASLFLILFCVMQSIFAQKLTVEQVITGLTEIPTIVQYKKFKSDIEALVVETTSNPNLSAEDYNALKTAYNGTKIKYDAFVGEIKADLLDFRNLKKMSDKPMEYSEKYMGGFNEAIIHYETNFIPVYNNIKSKERVIPPQLIQAGIQGFIMLVDFLKKRHNDNKVHQNDILNSINKMFTTPLAMTPWEILVQTPAPAPPIVPIPANPVTPNTNGGGATKGGTIAPVPPVVPATPNTPVNPGALNENKVSGLPIQVPYPTIKELNGEIEFLYVSSLQPIKLSNMAFEPKLRKLVVGSVQGGAANEAVETGFNSVASYPEYTSFQIKVKNTALMYAFAFNLDKTCYDVYPFPEEWIEAYKMSNKNRALKVGPLMLKSEENIVTIPSRNADSGEENYINIEGKATQELFCLLLSKSELNTVELYKKIELAQGNLEERLKMVLGDEMLSTEEANVRMENGKIFYNADALSKKVLPLVFVIHRR